MEGRQHPVGMLEEETHGLSFSDLHVSSGKRGSHQSSKPQVHTCSAEKLTPLMHKFRLKLASRMEDDLDLSWTKIWNEERQLLLEEVKDQPGLLQQVILEMGDAELFR